MDAGLSAESQARCAAALTYIEDMSEWYDEEMEDRPKLEFVRGILGQIAWKGPLNDAERAFCDAELLRRFGPEGMT